MKSSPRLGPGPTADELYAEKKSISRERLPVRFDLTSLALRDEYSVNARPSLGRPGYKRSLFGKATAGDCYFEAGGIKTSDVTLALTAAPEGRTDLIGHIVFAGDAAHIDLLMPAESFEALVALCESDAGFSMIRIVASLDYFEAQMGGHVLLLTENKAYRAVFHDILLQRQTVKVLGDEDAAQRSEQRIKNEGALVKAVQIVAAAVFLHCVITFMRR